MLRNLSTADSFDNSNLHPLGKFIYFPVRTSYNAACYCHSLTGTVQVLCFKKLRQVVNTLAYLNFTLVNLYFHNPKIKKASRREIIRQRDSDESFKSFRRY